MPAVKNVRLEAIVLMPEDSLAAPPPMGPILAAFEGSASEAAADGRPSGSPTGGSS